MNAGALTALTFVAGSVLASPGPPPRERAEARVFATFAEMLGQRVRDGLDSVSVVPTLTGEPGRQKDLASAREDIVAQAARYMNEAHVPDPRWSVR